MRSFNIIFLFLIIVSVVLSACTPKIISDSNTKPDIEVIDAITSDMIVIRYMWDGMIRENLEYLGKDVVINLKYYEENMMKRGDIVYFKRPEIDKDKFPNIQTSEENDILRVVGLAGEQVTIEKGQIYINGKKLDTFYGSFHHRGMDFDQYLKWREETNQADEYDKPAFLELTVPADHVFLLGDDWFRGIDSRVFGPMPIENIRGKVLGYGR